MVHWSLSFRGCNILPKVHILSKCLSWYRQIHASSFCLSLCLSLCIHPSTSIHSGGKEHRHWSQLSWDDFPALPVLAVQPAVAYSDAQFSCLWSGDIWGAWMAKSLNIRLPLRSWSHSSWVQAWIGWTQALLLSLSLCPPGILSVSLSLPLVHLCPLSLSKKKNKKVETFDMIWLLLIKWVNTDKVLERILPEIKILNKWTLLFTHKYICKHTHFNLHGVHIHRCLAFKKLIDYEYFSCKYM